LLREVVPGLRRLAIMGNVGYSGSVLEMSEVQETAHTFGLEVTRSEIRRAEDIAAAVEALKGRADAFYVIGDSLVDANRISINTLALSARLPTMHIVKEAVEAGVSHVLWTKLPGPVPTRRRLCRQDSAPAFRPASRAADQVRSRHQSHNRQ